MTSPALPGCERHLVRELVLLAERVGVRHRHAVRDQPSRLHVAAEAAVVRLARNSSWGGRVGGAIHGDQRIPPRIRWRSGEVRTLRTSSQCPPVRTLSAALLSGGVSQVPHVHRRPHHPWLRRRHHEHDGPSLALHKRGRFKMPKKTRLAFHCQGLKPLLIERELPSVSLCATRARGFCFTSQRILFHLSKHVFDRRRAPFPT